MEWSRDTTRFIKNSLSPALVMKVQIDQEQETATAVVPERQLSLAIGKEGQNARLAAKLTGLKIDIISDVEADAIEAERARVTAQRARPAPTQEEEPSAEKTPDPIMEETIVEETVVEEAAEPVEATSPEPQPVAEEPPPPPELEHQPPAAVPVSELEADEPPVTQEIEYGQPEIPDEVFDAQEEPAPVSETEEATPLHDLPDDIWTVTQASTGDSGVIRFAEDIEELALRGTRSSAGKRRRGGGNNRRRGPARRR